RDERPAMLACFEPNGAVDVGRGDAIDRALNLGEWADLGAVADYVGAARRDEPFAGARRRAALAALSLGRAIEPDAATSAGAAVAPAIGRLRRLAALALIAGIEAVGGLRRA